MARPTAQPKKPPARMSLAHHLIELRNRFFISAAVIVVGLIGGWFLSDFIWNAMREPVLTIVENQARNAQINYPDITSAFDLKLRISLYIGLVLTSPVWLYQIFAFLMPGLTRTEKKYTFGFFFSAVPLFLAGCAAGWYVLPNIVNLMTSFAPSEDAAFIDATKYLDFILKLVLAVGIAFVVPVFIVLLNFAGVLSAQAILKSWRIAILLICLFTAIATPAADVFSMFLLAVPMVMLYFVAYGIAYLHDRMAAKRMAKIAQDGYPV